MITARFGALWLVAAGLLSGLLVIAFGSVRWGGLVLAGTLLTAAAFRLVAPTARAGGLAVRSRLADVLFLFGMATAMFFLVIALDLRPRG
jgi:hypothetical protein